MATQPRSTARYQGWAKQVVRMPSKDGTGSNGVVGEDADGDGGGSDSDDIFETTTSNFTPNSAIKRTSDGSEHVRLKRHCSSQHVETVDLTSSSPPRPAKQPARRSVDPSAAVPSPVKIAPIFLRQSSQFENQAENADLRDASGYKPLSFHMPRGTTSKWWTHELYRGPGGKKVKVEYCSTKEEMEKVCRTYLTEPIVGFDMEWWPKAGGIKGNISLIQVGVEDRVALFHIAMFKGKTINELVSPSLRKLVESPSIIKTGSAVYAADGKRLKRFMHLEPRGFLELGHLHRVVMFANTKPFLVNNAGWALAKQVKEHFGIAMSKGPVRCSNWTQKLTPSQIVYAASDAYAGYMLYRIMELRRVAMSPVPPKPAFAELFLRVRASEEEEITKIPASIAHAIHRPELVEGPGDSLPDRIFEALRVRRKWFAKKEDVPAYDIVLNTTLKALVAARPTSDVEMAAVQGMTEEKIKKYGSEWLRILKTFPPADAEPSTPLPPSTAAPPSSGDSVGTTPFKVPPRFDSSPVTVEDSAASTTPANSSGTRGRSSTTPASSLHSPSKITATTPATSVSSTSTGPSSPFETDTKRALSVLRALSARFATQHQLPRDFISEISLAELAKQHGHSRPLNMNSPRLSIFKDLLERGDIDLEQFLMKRAPRTERPTGTLPGKTTGLTPEAGRLQIELNAERPPLARLPSNVVPSSQGDQPNMNATTASPDTFRSTAMGARGKIGLMGAFGRQTSDATDISEFDDSDIEDEDGQDDMGEDIDDDEEEEKQDEGEERPG